jgi:hypothetical protein
MMFAIALFIVVVVVPSVMILHSMWIGHNKHYTEEQYQQDLANARDEDDGE